LKLRLVLKTTTKKDKEVCIKLALPPSKHLGFINFINLALSQDKPVSLTFEKINKKGDKEESKNLKEKAMLNWKLKLKIERKKGKNSTKKEFKANFY